MLLVLFSFFASLPSGAFNFSAIFLSKDFRLEISYRHNSQHNNFATRSDLFDSLKTTQFHKLQFRLFKFNLISQNDLQFTIITIDWRSSFDYCLSLLLFMTEYIRIQLIEESRCINVKLVFENKFNAFVIMNANKCFN